VATNSYGYDASGTRVRLVTGGVTYTNSVSAGYRVTQVKTNGTVVETYGYDNGGRITSIVHSGSTLNLGYNTADQVAAVTNGPAWNQYTYDAVSRRVKATDQTGAQRRFLVAPTPGTELESPQLITDSGNSLKQGYVLAGDEPILRFDSSGGTSRVYYLEDGIGSVIGLAPDGSPTTNNTTRLFYNGFGSLRATNGPAPTVPTGTGGDFRFHGQWWESATDFYHMRARDYDTRTGRFLSRDPLEGSFRVPETQHPYNYANDNPYIYSDPSGQFTIIEINISTAIESSLQGFKTYAINRAKSYITDKIVDSFSRVAVRTISAIFPGVGDLIEAISGEGDAITKGITLEQHVLNRFCGVVNDKAGNIMRYVYLYPGIRPETGDAEFSGIHCPLAGVPKLEGLVYPDFVIGEDDPRGRGRNSWFIGDVKLSGNSLYNQYVVEGKRNKFSQFQGIVNYAAEHTHTRMAVFMAFFSGDRGKLSSVGRLMMRDGVKKGVIVFVFAVSKNKGF